MPIAMYPDNTSGSSNSEISGGGIFVVGSGGDKVLYERQDGIKIVYDRSLDTVILGNDTSNDVSISFNAQFIINADYSSDTTWSTASASNIIVSQNSSSFLTSSADPFVGTILYDSSVSFTDPDLVRWYFDEFSIIQYDGIYTDELPALSYDQFQLSVRGVVDYAATNEYVYVGWMGPPPLIFS